MCLYQGPQFHAIVCFLRIENAGFVLLAQILGSFVPQVGGNPVLQGEVQRREASAIVGQEIKSLEVMRRDQDVFKDHVRSLEKHL